MTAVLETERSIIDRIIEEHSVTTCNIVDYVGCFLFEGYFIPNDLLLETELEQQIYNYMKPKHDNVYKDAQDAKIMVMILIVVFSLLVYLLS